MASEAHANEPDFAELSARTYRLCLALLGGRAEAADAAQEALTRAWAGQSRKRPDVDWFTWAGGFAVRVSREVRRSRLRYRSPDTLEAEVPPVDAAWPAELAEQQLSARLAALQRSVLTLPDRQREVVTLRHLMDLSTEQTAAVLGCPAGTVKSNLHKAMARLQAMMQRDQQDEGPISQSSRPRA